MLTQLLAAPACSLQLSLLDGGERKEIQKVNYVRNETDFHLAKLCQIWYILSLAVTQSSLQSGG